ncbi:MAG: D-glycero-beta-D-manno-heptose 1,7-bisphosphate 7-phosphatase [Pseudomonadales bacterium]
MTRLILLDRDGVINFDSPHYIKNADEWLPIPGSLSAIAKLKAAGFLVAICTNQAGIGRGIFSEAALAGIHAKLEQMLARHGTTLDGLVHCPHHPDECCGCRKPRPGMLLSMMQRLQVNPAQALFVGDSVRDLEAAQAAGCAAALVRTGKGADAEPTARAMGVTCIADDLADLAAMLLCRSPDVPGDQP